MMEKVVVDYPPADREDRLRWEVRWRYVSPVDDPVRGVYGWPQLHTRHRFKFAAESKYWQITTGFAHVELVDRFAEGGPQMVMHRYIPPVAL